MVSIKDVKAYWEAHPLLSYEFDINNLEQFFTKLDEAKKGDAEKFSIKYWEFNNFLDKKALDIGCGPGWYTVNYAKNGATVFSVDLTLHAVQLAKEHLKHYELPERVLEGNAEALPFKNGCFDLVVSSGVLHHTPDTYKTFEEAYRVLKKNGVAKITLYRKSFIHKKFFFIIIKKLMVMTKTKHPGGNLGKTAKSADEFVRQYDGFENPIGIAKTNREWANLLEKVGFKVQFIENHYFPKRFVPFNKFIPRFVHYLLDKYIGTMAYFELIKR